MVEQFSALLVLALASTTATELQPSEVLPVPNGKAPQNIKGYVTGVRCQPNPSGPKLSWPPADPVNSHDFLLVFHDGQQVRSFFMPGGGSTFEYDFKSVGSRVSVPSYVFKTTRVNGKYLYVEHAGGSTYRNWDKKMSCTVGPHVD
jgi:hypothetical protein